MEQFLTIVASAGVASLVLAWLIRSLVIHLLSKDVEAYKVKLQSESGSELENLKHKLRITATEHSTRYVLLEERRAEVVAELYARLIRFLEAAGSFAAIMEYSGEPSKEEKANLLGEGGRVLEILFRASNLLSRRNC